MCLCFLGRGTWRSWMVLLCFCCTSMGCGGDGVGVLVSEGGQGVHPEPAAHVERAVWASTSIQQQGTETAVQGLGCEGERFKGGCSREAIDVGSQRQGIDYRCFVLGWFQ